VWAGETQADIHPDGSRFIAISVPNEATQGINTPFELYLATNWFEELRTPMGEN